jgi:hypothetical protein
VEGFPYFFHVRAGNAVLKHPLYQKYNMLTLEQIQALNGGQGFKDLATEMTSMIMTNDNMPIMWYLRTLYKTAKEVGVIE